MKMMDPDVQALWAQCVHAVRLAPGIDRRTVRKWLCDAVPRHSSGFRAFVFDTDTVWFADPKLATVCALKWA